MDVERIVLGCGNFGGVGSDLSLAGKGDSDEEAFALMDAAWARGVTKFDTASSYGAGRSELAIGRWLASRKPKGLRLTSKVFHPTFDGDDSGLAPDRIRRIVRQSLARLGVERIDLYLVHAPDPLTPLAESLGALDELVSKGVIGAIGLSNVDGAYLAEALTLTQIALVQNEYSLLAREAEREVLPLCAEHGIAFEAFSPLGGGWLTGKYRRGQPFPAGSRMALRPEPYEAWLREDVFDALEAFEARGDPATLALAWVVSHPNVAAAVIGPRRAEQLAELLAALELDVDRNELGDLFT